MVSDFASSDFAERCVRQKALDHGKVRWSCWKALEYVNVNMTEDISVQDIADALNVSRYYLSHAV